MNTPKVIQAGPFKGKRIEMAPASRLALVRDVADDFMRQVFEMEPGDYLITDDSSLFDFAGPGDAALKEICARIRQVYDLDVSGIPNGNLVDIFVRIRGLH